MPEAALYKIAKQATVAKNERGRKPSREEQAVLHLIMALCWLILGGVLLAWRWSDQPAPSATIWGTGIPLGWFGVAMALYNLLRWWLDHRAKKSLGQKLP